MTEEEKRNIGRPRHGPENKGKQSISIDLRLAAFLEIKGKGNISEAIVTACKGHYKLDDNYLPWDELP